MARYKGAVCRLCRREGTKLFLKGTRCSTDKCAFTRRSYSPGQHGQRRTKLSDYGVQLREKQKARKIYGILERQFRLYFKRAERSKGVTGHNLLQLLERRLDNVVFRLCFATSRAEARQMVKHGYIGVDGKKVDIPSYSIKQGNVVQVRGTEKRLKRVRETVELLKERGIPSWIKAEHKELRGTIIRLPERSDIGFPIQEQLIVELYSK